MEIRLTNVAKIESASLKLDGITVIAGNNNTGKSTIGKTVFSLFNSLVNIDEKIEIQKEQMIVRLLRQEVEQGLFRYEKDGYYTRISPLQLREYAAEICSKEDLESCREILNRFSRYITKKNKDENVVEKMLAEVDRIRSLPIERLSKSAVSAYFNRIFNSEINNIYRPDERAVIDATIREKKLRIEFENNNCIDMQQQINILNEAVYLDNPFVINYLNHGFFSRDEIEQVTIEKLSEKTDAVNDIVQYSLVAEKMQEVLNKINEVTSGSLLAEGRQSYYYKENGREKLNINNLSAGLKSFVIIKTLLEKGALKEKDILILDEPEIHLHPAWQLIYAEVIVLLQKTFELTVVLTTHSAHFLDALSYFAKKYEVEYKCNYYLSDVAEYGCVLKDVTDDLTQIYTQLVDPSILLDKLKYKMEEERNE